MITLDHIPTFTKDVPIPIPGGATVLVRFRFRYYDTEGFFSLCKESSDAGESDDVFFARFVDGWEGKNIAMPFSQDNLAGVLRKYPRSRNAIFNTFRNELFGAPEKNF